MVKSIFKEKYSSIILIILSFNLSLAAQDKHQTFLTAGYGYYEATFIGIKHSGIKNNQWLAGAGYNFNLDNLSYLSLFGEYQKTILKRAIRTNIGSKVIFWRQSDPYLIWGNLGINPNLSAEYNISDVIVINGALGPIFNFNLYNHRKSYEKTAWVKKTDINFSLSISYDLSSKK